MKRICSLLVMFGLAALGANAQTVTGSGTTNTVPKFTGSSTIGDSQIRQIDDNIGINTDFIVGRLSVFESRETGVNFSQPYALYGNISTGTNFAAGVRGDASATTGQASGVIGVTYGPHGSGVLGLAQHPDGGSFGVSGGHGSAVGGGGAGVFGTTQSTTGFSSGVWGAALGTTGPGVGVMGTTASPSANGVFGNNPNTDGQGGGGVFGSTSATTGFSYGVRGDAAGTSGSAVALFGEAFSPNGFPAYLANRAGGDIIVGVVSQNPDVRVFRVDGHGTIFADGGFRPFGADFAESVAVKGGSEHYAPGDLLVIDASGERRLSLSQAPYSTLVAGIYSTQPGVVASTHRLDEALPNNEVPLAVVGIVPCKVTAENGPVVAGDLLVTSSTPGHAMKGTDRGRMLGAIVGKALEPLQKGSGVIQILVTLQ